MPKPVFWENKTKNIWKCRLLKKGSANKACFWLEPMFFLILLNPYVLALCMQTIYRNREQDGVTPHHLIKLVINNCYNNVNFVS